MNECYISAIKKDCLQKLKSIFDNEKSDWDSSVEVSGNNLLMVNIKAPPFLKYYLKAHEIFKDDANNLNSDGDKISGLTKEMDEFVSQGFIPVSPEMFRNLPKDCGLIKKDGLVLYVKLDETKIECEINNAVTDALNSFDENIYSPLKIENRMIRDDLDRANKEIKIMKDFALLFKKYMEEGLND